MSEDKAAPVSNPADPRPQSTGGPSLTGLAVAVVAMNRFLASTNPRYAAHMQGALDSAMASSLDDKDLDVLRLLIKSASLTM